MQNYLNLLVTVFIRTVMKQMIVPFLLACSSVGGCQTTTPTNCKAYLAKETPDQVRAIADAIVRGSMPLIHNQEIVGAVDARGKVTGCDPRKP